MELSNLSICMIVKNEENNLHECLKPFKHSKCEIVIVDTGSTDSTVEIAKQYNAKVATFKWIDDFSAARNSSLENATHPWILCLDGDDRMDEDSLLKIEELIHGNTKTAYAFKIKNIKKGGLGEEFLQIRMFPNDKNIKFERSVHEQLSTSLFENSYKVIKKPEVEILHTGYFNKEIKKEKALRNQKIIEKDILNHPDDPVYLSAYADTFYVLDQFDNGIKIYESILKIPGLKETQKDLFDYIPVLIAHGYHNLNDFEKAHSEIKKGLVNSPDNINLLFLGGEICFENNNINLALDYYLKALNAPLSLGYAPSNNTAFKIKASYRIGKIHHMNKDYDKAIEYYENLIREHPNLYDMPVNLGEVYLDKGLLKKAVDLFLKSLKEFPGKDERAFFYLGKISANLGQKATAKEYYEKGLKVFPKSQILQSELNTVNS